MHRVWTSYTTTSLWSAWSEWGGISSVLILYLWRGIIVRKIVCWSLETKVGHTVQTEVASPIRSETMALDQCSTHSRAANPWYISLWANPLSSIPPYCYPTLPPAIPLIFPPLPYTRPIFTTTPSCPSTPTPTTSPLLHPQSQKSPSSAPNSPAPPANTPSDSRYSRTLITRASRSSLNNMTP